MGKFRGPNQKAAAAMEKKAAHSEAVDAKQAAARERELEQEWNQGANTRGSSRAADQAQKADEAARKRREKAELLAAEEASNPTGKIKKVPTLSKKKGKKDNDLSLLDDLSLLENALVGAADKKVKAKKTEERLKKEREVEAQKKKEAKESKPMDPLFVNTEQMIAGTADDLVGRKANVAQGVDVAASGIDGALDSLHISGGGGAAVVTSAKALFKAFEERMLPVVKEEYPGLKLSQYKEKIFQLWKKSPENPANQPK